jgi:hypothetical protein
MPLEVIKCTDKFKPVHLYFENLESYYYIYFSLYTAYEVVV